MPTIGIVGLGYVGQAVASSYRSKANLVCVDIDPDKSTNKFIDLQYTDAIFICVPSPAAHDGSCNGSILVEVLEKLQNYPNVIISKTTATPNVYKALSYKNLVHVPEFLTAKNNISDYANETSCIIGGQDQTFINCALDIIKLGQTKIKSAYICTLQEAVFAKYVENCFLATKVVFMNEMANLAKQNNINWAKVAGILQKDPRVGLSHCSVPGHDGLPGFGGHCFPKDTQAFLHYAKSLQTDLSILELAINLNKKIRDENN